MDNKDINEPKETTPLDQIKNLTIDTPFEQIKNLTIDSLLWIFPYG